MNRIIYALSAVLCLTFASCGKEEEMWKSETFDYAGRYVFGLFDAAGNEQVGLSNSNELQLFSSAANISSELWMEVVSSKDNVLPVKGKFSITGAPATFSGAETVNVKSGSYYIFVDDDMGYLPLTTAFASVIPLPVSATEERNGIRGYTHVTLDEAKIMPGAATSIGGNTVDSIYVKITLHNSNMKFVAKEVNPLLWEDPVVPEYEWTSKASSEVYDASSAVTFMLKGYRYTGYPEDR